MRRISGLFLVLLFAASTAFANQLNEAEQLLNGGDTAAAITVVNRLLEDNPSYPEARFLKGLILVEQGYSEDAVAVFTSLTKDYPELPEPYNNIAVIHAANGDYDRARTALQSALKTHPSYATAYENLGDIYAKLASEAYQQALELDKKDQNNLRVKLSLIGDLFYGGESANNAESATGLVAGNAEPETMPEVIDPSVVKPEEPEPVVVVAAAVTKPVVVEQVVDQQAALQETIASWAAAWSSQNVESYLSFYASSFKPAKGSVAKWRMQRHIRLKKPEYIKVTLTNIDIVRVKDDSARIDLTQRFESNTYQDVSSKRFELVLVNGKWKINREKSI